MWMDIIEILSQNWIFYIFILTFCNPYSAKQFSQEKTFSQGTPYETITFHRNCFRSIPFLHRKARGNSNTWDWYCHIKRATALVVVC